MAVRNGRITTIAVLSVFALSGQALAGPSDEASPKPAQPAVTTPAADAPKPQGEPKGPDAAKPQDQAKESKAQAAPAGTSAVVMDLSAIQGLIGKSVTSSAGEDMGRIVDLLVTPTGIVRAAVIDFGGFLGVGSRKVAVDWKALSFADISKGGAIRLALTRDQVRVSPEYKSGDPVVILETSKPSDAKSVETKPSAAAASSSEPKAPEAAGK